MRKSTLLVIIGITSLIMMSCSLGGIAQIVLDSQPTDELTILQPTDTVESLPMQRQEQTNVLDNTPTPTVDPLIVSKNCLAKTWEIDGLSDYVLAAVPPDLAEEYSLEYIDTTGTAYLKLTSDENRILITSQLD